MKSLMVGLLALVATAGIPLMIGKTAAQSSRPYAGMQARANGYPGPRHVLELAEQLGLTDQQRADVQRLFEEMTVEVVPIGEKLISQEAELDRLFAHRVVTPSSLGSVMAAIGATQAELRKAHLKYHLITSGLLTAAQMQNYSRLRGYAGEGSPSSTGRTIE
jgi:Spy/CpxP family protein refolding chaperone